MTLRNILVKAGYYLGENFIFRMLCALLMCLYCYASYMHYKICIADSESSNISQNTVSFICTSSLAFFIFLASCHLLVNIFDQKADGLYKKIGKQMVLTNQFFLTRLLGEVKIYFWKNVMTENMVLNTISYSYSCDSFAPDRSDNNSDLINFIKLCP